MLEKPRIVAASFCGIRYWLCKGNGFVRRGLTPKQAHDNWLMSLAMGFWP